MFSIGGSDSARSSTARAGSALGDAGNGSCLGRLGDVKNDD